MLIVALYFLFLSVTLFPYGFALSHYVYGGKETNVWKSLLVGLAAVCSLSVFFSLFTAMNEYALLAYLICSFGIFALYLKKIKAYFKNALSSFATIHLLSFAYFFLYAIIIIYKSSQVPELGDEAGYYFDSIKWINNAPPIPGLACYMPRIGFNSSWFVLSALLNFDFVGGIPMNDLPSFAALVFAGYSGLRLNRLLRKKTETPVSDVAALMVNVMLYKNFYTSSGVDLPNIVFSAFLIIECVSIVEKKEKNREFLKPLIFLIYIGFFLATIKFSSITLTALPSVLFFIYIYKSKRFASVFIPVFIAIFVFIPWFYRSVILTGYLVFPLYQIDFFNVEWKVPLELTRWHYKNVEAYAKISHVPQYFAYQLDYEKYSGLGWFPSWFRSANLINKTVFLSATSAILINMVLVARDYFANKKFWLSIPAILLTLYPALLLWFFKSPAMRFGFGLLLGFSSVVFSFVFFKLKNNKFFSKREEFLAYAFVLAITAHFLQLSFSSQKEGFFPIKPAGIEAYLMSSKHLTKTQRDLKRLKLTSKRPVLSERQYLRMKEKISAKDIIIFEEKNSSPSP